MSLKMSNQEFFASFLLNVIAGLIGGLIVALIFMREYALWQRLGALLVSIVVFWFIALGIHQLMLKK